MKKRIVFILLTAFLISCTSIPHKSLKEYQNSVDYSCNRDSECQVKDIRNCCGYFPECVNKNFNPDINLVKQFCEEENIFSTCGFKEISECQCINNKCEGQ